MTRGQITVIAKYYGSKEPTIITSIEFNGDMYMDGHGKQVVNLLKKVVDIANYQYAVAKFNNEHHHYNDPQLTYNLNNLNVLDFTKDYFENWFSDYVYLKNITDETVCIKTSNGEHELNPGDIAVLCFGRLEKMKRAK